MTRRRRAELVEVSELSPSVKSLTFAMRDGSHGSPVGHVAGQHVDLIVPTPHGLAFRRSYSIASAPDARHTGSVRSCGNACRGRPHVERAARARPGRVGRRRRPEGHVRQEGRRPCASRTLRRDRDRPRSRPRDAPGRDAPRRGAALGRSLRLPHARRSALARGAAAPRARLPASIRDDDPLASSSRLERRNGVRPAPRGCACGSAPRRARVRLRSERDGG